MQLRLVSFNIHCCDGPDGHSVLERAPRLHTVLAPLKADLIGFQEATPQWMTLLTRDFGAEYEIYHVYRGAKSLESTPFAWRKDRFQCLDKGFSWFGENPEVESNDWDALYHCPRIFTWARLREISCGREFCFVSTHFGFGDEGQVKSAQMLLDFAAGLDCPCLITGDFNMEMHSPGYRKMTERFLDVNAETVNDPGKTFHGYQPDRVSEHIDYCFVSKDAAPKGFRILTDQVDGKFPSDHYGLHAVVSL